MAPGEIRSPWRGQSSRLRGFELGLLAFSLLISSTFAANLAVGGSHGLTSATSGGVTSPAPLAAPLSRLTAPLGLGGSPSLASTGASVAQPASATPHVSAVSTIDLVRNSVVAPTAILRYANGLAGIDYNPVDHLEFVSGVESSSLVAVDPSGGIVQTVPSVLSATDTGVNAGLGAVAYDSANGQVFVAVPNLDRVLVYNTSGSISAGPVIQLPNRSHPVALAVDPVNNRVFVANILNDTVSVILGSNDTYVGDIGVGGGPDALAYDPIQKLIYVANSQTANITWIDPALLTTSGSNYFVRNDPVALSFVSTRNEIWVGQPDGITIVNASTRASSVNVLLPTGSQATSLEWDPSKAQMYVLNAPRGSISVYSGAGSYLFGIPEGGSPVAAAYDSALLEVDLIDNATNHLVRIPDTTQSVAQRVSVGATPVGSAFNPITDRIDVADALSNRIIEVDARATGTGATPIVRSLAVPGHPVDVAFDAAAGWIIVASNPGKIVALNGSTGSIVRTVDLGATATLWNVMVADGEVFVTGGSGFLNILNATSLSQTGAAIRLGPTSSAPRGLAYDPGHQTVFVAMAGEDRVVGIDASTDQMVLNFSVGRQPTGLAFDSDLGNLFVTNSLSDTVSVYSVSTRSILLAIPVGHLPGWASYVPSSHEVIVSSARSDQVAVIDASGLVVATSLSVGSYPSGLSYSPVNGALFVSDPPSSALTVIALTVPAGAPFIASLSAAPLKTDVSFPLTLSVTANLPPWAFAYLYLSLPGGCLTANRSILVCYPTSVSVGLNVSVRVTNQAGDSTTSSALVGIMADPMIASFTAAPLVVTLGRPVALHATVVGGVAPFKYVYSQVPQGCVASATTNWTCLSAVFGTLTVVVSVTDAVGYPVTSSTTFTVNILPTLSSTLSSASTIVGQMVAITAIASGGTEPYSYNYTGLPGGCLSKNLTRIFCTPSSAGVFPIHVKMTDASGVQRTVVKTLTVAPAPGPLSNGLLTLWLLVIGLAVVAAVLIIALVRRRRSAARPPPGEPETDSGTDESTYSATRSKTPESRVDMVAARGPVSPEWRPTRSEEALPPTYYTAPEDEPPAVSEPPPPSSGEARPAIACPYCGTMNEPWLVNCRWCRRALART